MISSNRIKKLQKSFHNFFFLICFPQKVEKIGYHSRFNPECDTERGCIDSLYIALGQQALLVVCYCAVDLASLH
jgi:hypothetical protein